MFPMNASLVKLHQKILKFFCLEVKLRKKDGYAGSMDLLLASEAYNLTCGQISILKDSPIE